MPKYEYVSCMLVLGIGLGLYHLILPDKCIYLGSFPLLAVEVQNGGLPPLQT